MRVFTAPALCLFLLFCTFYIFINILYFYKMYFYFHLLKFRKKTHTPPLPFGIWDKMLFFKWQILKNHRIFCRFDNTFYFILIVFERVFKSFVVFKVFFIFIFIILHYILYVYTLTRAPTHTEQI